MPVEPGPGKDFVRRVRPGVIQDQDFSWMSSWMRPGRFALIGCDAMALEQSRCPRPEGHEIKTAPNPGWLRDAESEAHQKPTNATMTAHRGGGAASVGHSASSILALRRAYAVRSRLATCRSSM